MINLMAFIEALKSTWIRRLLISDCKWQIFIKQYRYIQIEKQTGCGMNYIQELKQCFLRKTMSPQPFSRVVGLEMTCEKLS